MYFAQTKWHVEDIKSLRPKWSTAQAMDFLVRNEKWIADRLVELGWEVIETLIAQEEIEKQTAKK